MNTFTQYYSKYEEVGHMCGEVGHSRAEVGRYVPVLPIHAITYSPSSPHAYQIYNPFHYSKK